MPPAAPKKRKAAEKDTSVGDASTSGQEESNVVYIGHIPHGFYEEQIRGFFSQFGTVTKVRVSRSKKTGKAKHFAFMEFQYPEVAKIAAEAMNNYMMFKEKLVVTVVPTEEVHPDLWKGANRKFRVYPWRKVERARHNADRTPEEQAARLQRVLRRDEERQKRIKAAGIDYDYTPIAAALPPQSKRTTFDEAD